MFTFSIAAVGIIFPAATVSCQLVGEVNEKVGVMVGVMVGAIVGGMVSGSCFLV